MVIVDPMPLVMAIASITVAGSLAAAVAITRVVMTGSVVVSWSWDEVARRRTVVCTS